MIITHIHGYTDQPYTYTAHSATDSSSKYRLAHHINTIDLSVSHQSTHTVTHSGGHRNTLTYTSFSSSPLWFRNVLTRGGLGVGKYAIFRSQSAK